MRWGLSVVLIAGCGRLGFDALGPIDALGTDSPVDATVFIVSFGETGTTTHPNVTIDSYIDESLPSLNFGGAPELVVDGPPLVRTILRFDIDAIPSTATVISSQLQLVVQNPSSDTTITALAIRESWTEGTFDGVAGFANWVERTNSASWTGVGASGGSVDPSTVVATLAPPISTGPITIPLAPATVGAWIAQPTENKGLAFTGTTADAVTFNSSESPNVADRPVLVVSYVE